MNPIESATVALLQARRERRRLPAPTLPDAASAYAVQAAVAQVLGWFAESPPGHWKSGGPSREAVLTHAPLPPAGVWHSPAVAGDWPLHERWIEAELALRIGTPVDAARAATLDLAAARQLVDALCVSIEIVDSRWVEALQAPALAKLADLQSHGALVLGAWRDFAPLRAHDWAAQALSVRIGAAEQTFRGSHAMGDPGFLLPTWLRHATQGGAVVAVGTVVTTGTWCGMLPARAGDAVAVRFEGLGDAEVQL